MHKPDFHTRRDFLRTTLLGGALTWTVPSFLELTMRSLQAEVLNSALAPRTGKDDTILVVLQLAGGNDGLNTVIPWSNDFYYTARPHLAIPAGEVIRITDEIAFHPALTGFQSLWDDGHLALIQGVGYPNPNRSHFRSMEIWQTASDAERFEQHGWIGRYFDNQCAGADVTVGVHVGSQAPQAFTAQQPKGITVPGSGPSAFRLDEALMPHLMADDEADGFGSSIEELGQAYAALPNETPIDFLERTAMDAQVSSTQIQQILETTTALDNYPDTALGNDLKLIARLIRGGMSTRIYYASLGGFDTHANQLTAQHRLLGVLGNAMQAFVQDLKQHGQLDRVALLVFSEFGRRVAENANLGTDHGAAAPVFVVGGPVRGGIYEDMPSLDPAHLYQGDLTYRVDFRSLYATLLERHLRAPSAPILGRSFPLLDFIQPAQIV